eukprot:359154-Chlamydomonas_euryale.AAC.7
MQLENCHKKRTAERRCSKDAAMTQQVVAADRLYRHGPAGRTLPQRCHGEHVGGKGSCVCPPHPKHVGGEGSCVCRPHPLRRRLTLRWSLSSPKCSASVSSHRKPRPASMPMYGGSPVIVWKMGTISSEPMPAGGGKGGRSAATRSRGPRACPCMEPAP